MPFSKASPAPIVGIDAGATLCKIACVRRKTIITHAFPSGDLAAVRDDIVRFAPSRIIATGGGATRIGDALGGVPVEITDEFGAWLRGAPALADDEGLGLPDRYLTVSLGTGTSILLTTKQESRRIAGTALGGGTLMGLAQLLTGVTKFEELAMLAQRGDRRKVDLLVGDIYRDEHTPLPRDLTASSFAKLASRAPEDLAHALIGLIGENIGLLCGQLASIHAARAVLYCGSTIGDNPVLRSVLLTLAQRFQHPALFLKRGAFGGAVGAALTGGLADI